MKCHYPTVRFIAFGTRDTAKIFVPDPSQRGRYIYTDRCVAEVSCPQCRAIPAEPCKGKQGYGAGTHCVRREAFKRRGWAFPPVEDNDVIIEEIEVWHG